MEIVVGLVLCFPAAVVWLRCGGGPADVVVVWCGGPRSGGTASMVGWWAPRPRSGGQQLWCVGGPVPLGGAPRLRWPWTSAV